MREGDEECAYKHVCVYALRVRGGEKEREERERRERGKERRETISGM